MGSDEATALTDAVSAALGDAGHAVELVGPLAGGTQEWAQVGLAVGRAVVQGAAEVGVLFCWTGTGAAIAANKVAGVRAALCVDAETARLARRYNHANVLVMSLRATSEQIGREIVDAFLSAPYGGDDFDLRNVAMLEQGHR